MIKYDKKCQSHKIKKIKLKKKINKNMIRKGKKKTPMTFVHLLPNVWLIISLRCVQILKSLASSFAFSYTILSFMMSSHIQFSYLLLKFSYLLLKQKRENDFELIICIHMKLFWKEKLD